MSSRQDWFLICLKMANLRRELDVNQGLEHQQLAKLQTNHYQFDNLYLGNSMARNMKMKSFQKKKTRQKEKTSTSSL